MGAVVYNKKINIAVIMIIVMAVATASIFLSGMAAEAASGFVYRDSENGATFTVPSGWTELASGSEAAENFDVEFYPENDMLNCIMYGSNDVWSIMPDYAKKGLTRADINNSKLQGENFFEEAGIPENEVINVINNGIEYMEYSTVYQFDSNGINISFDMITLMCMRDGIMYAFKFFGTADSPYHSDFISVLNSVEYSPPINPADNTSASSGYVPTDTYYQFIAFFITVFLYTLPIIIYRYLIRKKPVEPSKSLYITAFYGVFAFIAIILLLKDSYGSFMETAGTAIFFFSLLNYYILAFRKKKYASEYRETVDISPENRTADDIFDEITQKSTQTFNDADNKFCRRCGNVLPEDSLYCSKCGAPVKR